MSTQSGSIANYSSGLGKYDGSLLYGLNATADISGVIGPSDLNLNTTGYIQNSNIQTLPAAITGANAGFTVTCWFNPLSTSATLSTSKSTLINLTCTAPSAGNIVVSVSGGNIYCLYPGSTALYGGTPTASGWNFVSYTVCASGGTVLSQSVFLNGTTYLAGATNGGVGGTYTAYTVSNILVGYGTGSYTQYFNGKIDDFRYYGRVLTLMEMNVLQRYSYNNMYSGSAGAATSAAIVPTLGGNPTFNGVNSVVTAVSTYTPLLPGNLQFWYDAADPLGTGVAPANGSNLITWCDKSGFGRHAAQYGGANCYGTYNSTGMNGLPTINFNPTSTSAIVGYAWANAQTYATYFPGSTGVTFFYVFQPKTSTYGTPTNGFWTIAELYGTFDYYSNNIYGTLYSSNLAVNCYPGAAPSPAILSTTLNTAGNFVQWKNGGGAGCTASASDTIGFGGAFNGMFIGTRTDKFTGYIGNISEVLLYTSVLTTAQRQQVEGYLAWKWGLQANLPTAHPYYLSPPLNTTNNAAITIALPSNGTYSAVKVNRYLNGALNASYNSSAAYVPAPGGLITSNSIVPTSLNTYAWNDTCYNSTYLLNYTYSFTPTVLGLYGASTLLSMSAVPTINVLGITTSNASYPGNRISPVNLTSGNLLSGDGIVTGSASTNGNAFNIYAFGTVNTTQTYTLSYSCFSPSIIYVLAVGGGGGAASSMGSGAGGVVMLPILVSPTTGSTMTISIGTGGAGSSGYSYGSSGNVTTITGTGLSYMGTSLSSIIGGGGGGGASPGYPGVSGGSGGGGANSAAGGTTTNANYNFANNGNTSAYYNGASGGAAGQAGIYGYNNLPAPGANGIQCMLPGIADFTSPNYASTPWSNYYWGGSGGACYGYGRPGGRGGGGGSSGCLYDVPGVGDTFGIYPAQNGNAAAGGGVGGACTGGGGGGGGGFSTTVGSGGAGGSGIVVLAFPSGSGTKSSYVTINNYNFASPAVALNASTNILNSAANTAGATSTTLTGWTCAASSSYTSIDLINGNSTTFGYSSTTVGYQNVFVSFTASAPTGCTATISQTVSFSSAGNYSLIYYVLQCPNLTGLPTVTASVGSTSGTAGNFYANSTWIAQRLNFAISAAGNYTLKFTVTNGTTGTAGGVGISFAFIM